MAPDSQIWDDRYLKPGFLFGLEPDTFLAAQRNMLRRVMKALSLGDGEGRNGVWLADQGLDVLPVDFSAPAQAKAHYHKPAGTSDKGRCG